MRYVALGDSYTIGTSVPPAERWPERLVAAVGPPDAPRLELVANLGVNGATSADLIRGQLPALAGLRPDLVSVLIGVNDVVRGVPPATYAANLERILGALLDRLPTDRIVTITIPDYTVTPAGGDYGDPRRQHDAIVAANATMTRLAANAGIACVDIFDLSERAAAGSDARRGRRAPPERRAVRRLGRAHRTHRHRPLRRLRRWLTPWD